MDIVIIGSGNVAAVLGRKFRAAGHRILQVYGRNATAASQLAYEWDTESTNYKSLLNRQAELYLIAVNDDAIEDVVDDLKLPGKIVVHTAASVSREILKTVTDHYGVLYPLQSLRKELPVVAEIPLFVDGSDEFTRSKLEALARTVSTSHVTVTGDDALAKLHVAAVFVNNFTNHLYVLAEEFCRKEGLDFRQLIPLIEETALRIRNNTPSGSQTGPALRHDRDTIQHHLALLKDYPRLSNIYLLMTESIQQGG